MFNTRATRAVPGMPVKMVVTVDGRNARLATPKLPPMPMASDRRQRQMCIRDRPMPIASAMARMVVFLSVKSPMLITRSPDADI